MQKACLIAHYNKDLNWTNEIDKSVHKFIYSSNPIFHNLTQVTNRGADASHYLSFIIDHYDNLPDKIVFCHHHRTDWTQEHSLPYIINNLDWNAADYFSIGARCNYWTCIPYDDKPHHINAMRRNWHILEPYLSYPEKLTYIAGTQFCTCKELILQYPKSFYQDCREWVYTVDEAEWFIGRFFEYTWHYILTKNPIEKDIKYLK